VAPAVIERTAPVGSKCGDAAGVSLRRGALWLKRSTILAINASNRVTDRTALVFELERRHRRTSHGRRTAAVTCRLLRRRARDLHVRRRHVSRGDLHAIECGAAGGRAAVRNPWRRVPAGPGHLRGRHGRALRSQGDVLVARDLLVALPVLRSSMDRTRDDRRLALELHLVANVRHQHVLPVIELGLQLFRRDSQDPNPRS
jgi:hypothetical protein